MEFLRNNLYIHHFLLGFHYDLMIIIGMILSLLGLILLAIIFITGQCIKIRLPIYYIFLVLSLYHFYIVLDREHILDKYAIFSFF